MQKKSAKFKVVTGKVRFSYVNVFSPVVQDYSKPPKYSISLIIPKSDEETINAINLAVYECKVANRHLWGDTPLEEIRGGLRDGDFEKNDPAYDDSMFINATATVRPGIVDKDTKPITNPTQFYSGCYGRAAITFYAHTAYGGQGIGCTLNNVQKLEEGDRLGSNSSPTDDFQTS